MWPTQASGVGLMQRWTRGHGLRQGINSRSYSQMKQYVDYAINLQGGDGPQLYCQVTAPVSFTVVDAAHVAASVIVAKAALP